MDDIVSTLDETCCYILAGISRHPEGIGFNRLLREIQKQPNSQYNKMAKTTLAQHIQHLLDKHFIENEIVKNSPLKFKPSKYRVSVYFKELSKGLIAQSVNPDDYLPLMRAEDAGKLTMHLMDLNLQYLSECIETVLQNPENIALFNINQTFYNLETLMRAYRERILERKEERIALKTIQDWVTKYRKIDEK